MNFIYQFVVCTSLLRHLCALLYTVLVFFRRQQRQTHQTLNDVLDVLTTSVRLFQADFVDAFDYLRLVQPSYASVGV